MRLLGVLSRSDKFHHQMVSPITANTVQRRQRGGREGVSLDVACSIHLHKHKQLSPSENTIRDELRECLVTWQASWPGQQVCVV